MTPPRYIVLRAAGEKFQTIGPMADAYHDPAAAEREAERLCAATGLFYAVAQVVAEYAQQRSIAVTRLAAPDLTVTPMKARKT